MRSPASLVRAFRLAPSVYCRTLRSGLATTQMATMATSSTAEGAQHEQVSEAFLSSFINHEQRGVPEAAGTAQSQEFDLGRMRRLLAALDDPQHGLKAVHVAGSKGKGSTATLLTSIFHAAGHRVGLYTSPHLRHITERIAVGGGGGSDGGASGGSGSRSRGGGSAVESVSRAAWSELVLRHRPALERVQRDEAGALSHFEVVTALAFRHFADEGVQVAVVEVGLGGVTDATNVFEPQQLLAAVITPLGMEHVAALGGTIHSIAAAKAGIMKRGRPAVVAAQPRHEAAAVLRHHAHELDCTLVLAEEQVQVRHRGYVSSGTPRHALREFIHVSVAGAPGWGCQDEAAEEEAEAEEAGPGRQQGAAATTPSYDWIEVQLVGAHQHVNIATAVATAWQLRKSLGVTWQDVRAGLARAYLAGRLQVVKLPEGGGGGPAGAGSGGKSVGALHAVLDGAHTRESAAALAAAVRHAFPTQPIALVLAMAEDKDHFGVVEELRALSPQVVVFTTVAIAGSNQRSAAPGTLAAQWQVAAMLQPTLESAAAASARRPFRCRELIQASLMAAVERARRELGACTGPLGGLLVVTGSLHVVAQAEDLLLPSPPPATED